ncbi:hypothetical protein UVI_02002980 [Ustilaginoidea virens]|uniref:Uncharacterized protein n=1 Tax=Ustilaginoidea virens TaxID=1159556 RepID=A0A1B5L258_USTVR|nr:hypothetical protein UVI_02002980 [Ustilaginoidea virens]
MLGDQAQKQKNSFKSIRRRRKNVTFAEPTYVDYSDFDYSTDDEDDIEELFGTRPNSLQRKERQQRRESREQEQHASKQNGLDDSIADDTVKVEPLKTRTRKGAAAQAANKLQAEDDVGSSEDSVEEKPEGPSRSRNGTVRNTDSFFKDDSVETKKITLTPNLLRDDNTPRPSSDSITREARSGSSLEKIDRELITDKEKKKLKEKDRKDKDKKSGGLRGFFSRKDRKKLSEDDDESFGKRSMDMMSDSRDSDDRSVEDQLSPERLGTAQRQSSKLQKAAPHNRTAPAGNGQKPLELSSYLAEGRTNDVSSVPPASMRIVDPETNEPQDVPSNQPANRDAEREPTLSTNAQREETLAASKRAASRGASSTGTDTKAQKPARAQTRLELDSSDSSGDDEPRTQRPPAATPTPPAGAEQRSRTDGSSRLPVNNRQVAHAAAAAKPEQQRSPRGDSLPRGLGGSEHPSPTGASNPPALVADSSSPEDISPEASPSPDPMSPMGDSGRGGSSASTAKEASWDDGKLLAFFDESDHIRDLLVVVYDKTNVEPAGTDHPVVGGLFREQNAKLAEITTVSFAILPHAVLVIKRYDC